MAILLPTLALARPRQDRLNPPLRSSAAEYAWLLDPNRPKVRLHMLPTVVAPVEPVLTASDQKHILDLIEQLATLTESDFGLPPTVSGLAFAPFPEQSRTEILRRAAHPNELLPARELIKLGPQALPLLLQHLDDPTPTRITIERVPWETMRYGHTLPCNEVNPMEQSLVKRARTLSAARHMPSLNSYQVKVGDICFDIIGQIVGRDYHCVRYGRTNSTAINSPVVDASLAREVRAVWSSPTPALHLFRALLIDYACRGIFGGWTLDGWSLGSDLQCQAAKRLLYYFPAQAGPMIALRLHQLNVDQTSWSGGEALTPDKMAVWMSRELINGVRTKNFLMAVSWCPEPHLQAELARIATRAGDNDVMAAALVGILPAQRPSLRPRIMERLNAKPDAHGERPRQEWMLLHTLAANWGADGKSILIEYMRDASPTRLMMVCSTLRIVRTDWDACILTPLLGDTRLLPDADSREKSIRVCDAAAEALAKWRPGLKFVITQPVSQRDQEIATIKAKIAQ